MRLFNRDADGAREIVAAVGLISNGISFDKWESVLPFGIRDVSNIVGRDVVKALADFYENEEAPTDAMPAECSESLAFLQKAVAFFAWLKIIPTLDAQHDNTGRSRRLGENETGLTALQEAKDEQNILRLAYDAVDALVDSLDRGGFAFWISSPAYRQREGLLVRSVEIFDRYYHIGSPRLFLTLLPIMREMQCSEVAPILGDDLLKSVLDDGVSARLADVRDTARRAVVLLSMQKAVERLPVEVIPEGIVQFQQSQPVNSRLKADNATRAAVAASLGADARRCLDRLEGLVADLSPDDDVSYAFTGPLVHSKGMSF